VVVVHHGSTAVGLLVDEILDVVDVAGKETQLGSRPGVAGCRVIQERVTELLDLDWILAQAAPEPAPLRRPDGLEDVALAGGWG
jgi:hypothetical protein